MRAVFGVLSLLIVVAIIGLLVRKQFATIAPAAQPTAAAPVGSMAIPSGTPQQQVQQFRQAVQGTMQQARPMPEDK
jgi:hypothetical protein